MRVWISDPGDAYGRVLGGRAGEVEASRLTLAHAAVDRLRSESQVRN